MTSRPDWLLLTPGTPPRRPPNHSCIPFQRTHPRASLEIPSWAPAASCSSYSTALDVSLSSWTKKNIDEDDGQLHLLGHQSGQVDAPSHLTIILLLSWTIYIQRGLFICFTRWKKVMYIWQLLTGQGQPLLLGKGWLLHACKMWFINCFFLIFLVDLCYVLVCETHVNTSCWKLMCYMFPRVGTFSAGPTSFDGIITTLRRIGTPMRHWPTVESWG